MQSGLSVVRKTDVPWQFLTHYQYAMGWKRLKLKVSYYYKCYILNLGDCPQRNQEDGHSFALCTCGFSPLKQNTKSFQNSWDWCYTYRVLLCVCPHDNSNNFCYRYSSLSRFIQLLKGGMHNASFFSLWTLHRILCAMLKTGNFTSSGLT